MSAPSHPALAPDPPLGPGNPALLDPALFQPIDRHFARLMERLAGQANEALALAAALLSRARAAGHICLDLRQTRDPDFMTELLDAPAPASFPEPGAWLTALRASPVVGRGGDFKPLILDPQGRLYLQRFWAAETALGQAILERARRPAMGVNEPLLQEGLQRLFGGRLPAVAESDAQARAAVTAVQRTLAVISGGPGTGKTRTVALLLALLLEQAGNARCRVALAAPTGKAAARLQESLQRLKSELACSEDVKARLPTEAFTVHRLLGVLPENARPRFDAENPLPFEIVVVDEASMIDLVMMTKLFAAVSPEARLILLGDPDQLASVEAGAILGDLCLGCGRAGPLPKCIVRLERNYRFGPNHGLLTLSQAVNAGHADAALQVLRKAQGQGISLQPLPPPPQLRAALRPWVLEHFAAALRAPEPRAALSALARSRLLVALRHGPYGLQHLNRIAEEILAEAGLIDPAHRAYAGRPILITRNDYQLGLFNGDVGMFLADPATGETRAWFLGAGDALRSCSPARLPEHETVFAMTVHKSQGSEFDQVLLLLPERPSPVLSRELIYTGITRARQRLDLWSPETVFRGAVARRADRPSGLREALWGQPTPELPPPVRSSKQQLELGL